jgi:hypothetical protein
LRKSVSSPSENSKGFGRRKNFSGVRRVEAADQMQQRAFARAGRAAQRHEIAARNFQIHAAQHFERAFADGVGFFQPARG